MATVVYFTQRHIKCISRLPGRALQAAVTAGEAATWTVPSHIARTSNRLRQIRSSVGCTIGEIRENVERMSHPLLAS